MSSDGCLGCVKMEVSTATLMDGRVVCNECPDWMLECEGRHILKTVKTDKKIRDALASRRDAGRGDVSRLREVMLKLRGL